MWPSAAEFLVAGCTSTFWNVLTGALPPQLSPQDLSGAKTGRSRGQEPLYSGPGNRTPRCSFHHLQLAFETPATNKISPNLHFLLGRLAESSGIM